MRKIFASALSIPVVITSLSAGALEIRPVGPGIIHYHDYCSTWHIHVLEIDITDTLVHLETVKAEDNVYGYERTSNMAARTDAEGHRVVGAINADFYAAGGITIGAQIVNGELVKQPYTTRSTFSMSDSKVPFIEVVQLHGAIFAGDSTAGISNVNAARTDGALILYNRFMGATTGTNEWGVEIMAQYLTAPVVNDTVWLEVASIDSGTVAGRGNNGGDGLVAARHLVNVGYDVSIELLDKHEQLSPDTKANWEQLAALTTNIYHVTDEISVQSCGPRCMGAVC